MHHRQQSVLRVRRIAVVFDALVPDQLDDDVIALRLINALELASEVAGVEILEHGSRVLRTRVPGARKGFWQRRAQRAERAELDGRDGAGGLRGPNPMLPSLVAVGGGGRRLQSERGRVPAPVAWESHHSAS